MVTGTNKPRIYVGKNTFVATAKQCLMTSDVTMEIIDTTGIDTPMGEIIITRSLSDGYIELAGPSVNTSMKEICIKLRDYGCDYVLCDGAVSRKTFASPTITDSTILCTGASVNKDIYKVVDETVHTVNLLSIKSADTDLSKLLWGNNDYKVCLIDKNHDIKYLPVLTSLEASGDIVENIDEHTKYIVIKGIISDRLLLGIIGSTHLYKNIIIIIEDGTKMFVSEKVYDMFIRSGGMIEALNSINLIGVTINPVSPFGYEFEKGRLESLISREINLPVYNVREDKNY
ncbi:hypothetical protein AN1V17_48420 [Vallitalea sediminicola]